MIMNRLLLGALLTCLLIGCGRTAQPTQTGNQDHLWPTLPPHIPTIEEFGYYADWQIRPSTDPSRIAIMITLYHSLWFEHVTAVISTGHQIDTQLQPLAKTAIDPTIPFVIELSVDRSRLQPPENEIMIVLNGQSSAAWINQVKLRQYLSLNNNEYILTSIPLHKPKVEEFLEPFDPVILTPSPYPAPSPQTVYMMETLDPAIPTPQN